MLQMQNTVLISELADELRVEGINCKGYGVIPKAAMTDRELSIQAKAIYAYFCSYSGAGNSSFPGRQKILSDLGIGKAAYYAHYNQLLETGYLSVEQKRSVDSKFYHNIYTLQRCPNKFKASIPESSLRKRFALIRTSGLKAAGFGFIPKSLMVDQRLSYKAKALYAYYSSFLGAGESAFPEKGVTLAHLNISAHTFEKLNKELLQLNYILIRQRHVNGRLGVNDVYLVEKPDETLAMSKHLIEKYEVFSLPHTEDESAQFEADIQCAKNQDTDIGVDVFQHSKKQDTENLDAKEQNTEKKDVMNNSKNKKQLPITSSLNNREEMDRATAFREKKRKYYAALGQEAYLKKYSMRQNRLQDEAVNEIFACGTLPLSRLYDHAFMKAAIEVITGDEEFGSEKMYDGILGGETSWNTFCLYRDGIIHMLTSEKGSFLSGKRISAEGFYRELCTVLVVDHTKLEISFGDLYDRVKENFENAVQTLEVRIPASYMRACIWNSLCNNGLLR